MKTPTFCHSLRLESHHSKLYLATAAGVLHVPGTLYLNERYDNPNTRVVAARALRVWVRLCDAFNIDLAARALQAQCLTETEKKALKQLVYLPIEKIESRSVRSVRTIASAKKMVQSPSKIEGTVQPNTAAKQLVQISDFLLWFHRKVLAPRMPIGSAVAEALQREYDVCANELKTALGGTKQAHPHSIRSLPNERFLQIYTAVFLNPGDVLRTGSGKTGANLLRDRAMILLACEGMRPGAIGNIALKDFKWIGGREPGYIAIKDNTARRTKVVRTSTPVQKGVASHQNYNSEITISIWPTTAEAIRNYIDSERLTITNQTLRNRTQGFLFVAEHGGPIGDRGTIAHVFRRAGKGLEEMGLLAKDPKDPYVQGEKYVFSAYLLRHSSASLFFAKKGHTIESDVVTDLMKMRFGWAMDSKMPILYAQRALSDAASVTVEEYMDSLFSDARVAKASQGEKG